MADVLWQIFEADYNTAVPPWVTAHPKNAAYNGNLAMYVLESFRFTRRFVDDLTAACNPFLKYLLYTNNSIPGGLIKGIYPHGALVLEPTNADMWSFPTLDIRILSKTRRVLEERDGLY
jgi:hypothetical protein